MIQFLQPPLSHQTNRCHCQVNCRLPRGGKNTTSAQRRRTGYFLFSFCFVLFCSTSQTSIYCSSCFRLSLTPTATCHASGVFLFLLSLSSPWVLCCFTQTDLASGRHGPVLVTHCTHQRVGNVTGRHRFKGQPDSVAAPNFFRRVVSF